MQMHLRLPMINLAFIKNVIINKQNNLKFIFKDNSLNNVTIRRVLVEFKIYLAAKPKICK